MNKNREPQIEGVCKDCRDGRLCATTIINVPVSGDTMIVPSCISYTIMESLFCDGVNKVIMTDYDGDLLLEHVSVEFIKPGHREVRNLPHRSFVSILLVPPGTMSEVD